MDGLIELVGAIAAWLAGPGALWLAGLVGPCGTIRGRPACRRTMTFAGRRAPRAVHNASTRPSVRPRRPAVRLPVAI